MENKIGLGRKLKQLRIERGLTLDELAMELNYKYNISIHKGAISKWENDINDPSLFHAVKIADYFKIKLEDLL